MKRSIAFALAVIGSLAIGGCFWLKPSSSLPVRAMVSGTGSFQVEVAADMASQIHGLMNRTSLPENGGMLFDFKTSATRCLWMRNTPIPLSVAWLDADSVVIAIQDMAPNTDDPHCSPKPSRYALEVGQGEFAKKGIKAGDRFE